MKKNAYDLVGVRCPVCAKYFRRVGIDYLNHVRTCKILRGKKK